MQRPAPINKPSPNLYTINLTSTPLFPSAAPATASMFLSHRDPIAPSHTYIPDPSLQMKQIILRANKFLHADHTSLLKYPDDSPSSASCRP